MQDMQMFNSSMFKKKNIMLETINAMAPKIDARDTYLKMAKTIINVKRRIPAIIGDMAKIPPKPVAMPLPPLKCKNGL